LKAISPQVIFVYYKLIHLKLFLAILSNFNIWLLLAILLMVINNYFINDYWWLLDAYFIAGY